MHLSADTLSILKNFSSINDNLIINEGSILNTCNAEDSIYATATVCEEFPCEFGIYSLTQFLSTLDLFKLPDLTFYDKYVSIVDKDDPSISIKYYKTNTQMLKRPRTLKQLPEPTATFVLTAMNLKRLNKARGPLKCDDLKIKNENNRIYAIVYDATGSNENTFTIELEEYFGEDFEVTLKQEKLALINGDYNCKIIANRILRCEHVDRPINYTIALDVTRKQ